VPAPAPVHVVRAAPKPAPRPAQPPVVIDDSG
jgi:hypothetical protein